MLTANSLNEQLRPAMLGEIKVTNLKTFKFLFNRDVILVSWTFDFLPLSDINYLTRVSVRKPVFQEDGYCVLFLGLSASFHSLLPLLFTSAPSITLLFWGLFSPPKRPCAHRYYWGLSVHLRECVQACGPPCAHVCVENRKVTGTWLTGFVIRNFKLPYIIFPIRRHVRATYSQLLSFNGGYWLHSWCQSPVATVKSWHSNKRSESLREVSLCEQIQRVCSCTLPGL